MIWTTLNGHEARNRGHCQEIVPTSHPHTCKVRWNGYGRRSVCASLPEVGAQCGSSARWDLRGGHRVTGVPTATAVERIEHLNRSPFWAIKIASWREKNGGPCHFFVSTRVATNSNAFFVSSKFVLCPPLGR